MPSSTPPSHDSSPTTLSRRRLIGASAVLPFAARAGLAQAQAVDGTPGATPMAPLPDRSAFAPMAEIYLDSGTMHPIPTGARATLATYLEARARGTSLNSDAMEKAAVEGFARLINADASEIALVQSTTAGEQLVIEALDIPASKGRIVTDTLHFFGSFWLYEELGRQGMDVVWLRPKDGRIDPDDYEKAITHDTRLVSLSLVSTYNGFEHDLKRICDIAHARGALVYADIVHAAGTVPIDVRANGVDFAACASYKWLMGDFGLGFLYVRADLLPHLKRPRYGYYQLAKFDPHVYPLDRPGNTIADNTPRSDAQGTFAMGTYSHTVLAMLSWSIPHLNAIGVDRISAWRQPLLARLHEGLAAKGYPVATPSDCRSPLVTAILPDARAKLAGPLQQAGVKITLIRNRFRVCVSLFNTMDDIEHLLDALPANT